MRAKPQNTVHKCFNLNLRISIINCSYCLVFIRLFALTDFLPPASRCIGFRKIFDSCFNRERNNRSVKRSEMYRHKRVMDKHNGTQKAMRNTSFKRTK